MINKGGLESKPNAITTSIQFVQLNAQARIIRRYQERQNSRIGLDAPELASCLENKC
jgi:hypothetical protein